MGGPGVQRPIKTIKYLKDYGYDIDVLTVGDIHFHSYDYELLKESKADNIYRTKSFDFMSLFKIVNSSLVRSEKNGIKNPKSKQPGIYFQTPETIKKIIRGLFPIDDKIGWFPFAYKKAKQLLKAKKYDLIIATIGPYTAGVLAYWLFKKTKTPYYIDYRDHWNLHPYPKYRLKILEWHAKKCEIKMLKHAKGVFVVSKLMREKMIFHFGDFLSGKIEVVYNGFDEDDFSNSPLQTPNSKLLSGTDKCAGYGNGTDKCVPYKFDTQTIRYIGNFYGNRNASYFIKALEEMQLKNEIPENVVFEFIGNYFTETIKLLETENLAKYIKIIPQVNHKKAVDYMQTADLLLLFIPTLDGEDFMTGKLFEYTRASVPILAMIPPNGEPANILKELGHKYICQMEDIVTIKKYLKDFLISEAKNGELSFDMKYSRQKQTEIFVAHLVP